MTQTEKDQKIAAITVDIENYVTTITALKSAREALEATPVTTPHKVWEPEHKENYHDSCVLINSVYHPSIGHDLTIEIGLAHPTKEAAERHHEFLKMLHDLHKFAVEHNEGWKPDWEDGAEKKWLLTFEGEAFLFSWAIYNRRSILPHFKSLEITRKAIDTFGDRLKILFEYYNS